MDDHLLGTVPEATLAAACAGLSSQTPRERQVLKHVIAGYTASDSAADLGISRRTVELHRQTVLSKLGARNLVSAVRPSRSSTSAGSRPSSSAPPVAARPAVPRSRRGLTAAAEPIRPPARSQGHR